MKLIAIHRTTEYRGDHTAEVEYIYDIKPDDLVYNIATKLFSGEHHLGRMVSSEEIAIKIIGEPGDWIGRMG